MRYTSRLLASGLLCSVGLTSLLPRVHASSVIPLGFEDIISEARDILRAEVVDMRAERSSSGHGRIDTVVTFRVERLLKGTLDRALVSLRFLGGVIGDEAMVVAGMPRFALGDRDVLCLGGEAGAISPLVGLMQGRFRVLRGPGGEEFVTLHDGSAFATTAQVLRPLRASATPIRTMTLEVFESEIGRAVGSRGAGR